MVTLRTQPLGLIIPAVAEVEVQLLLGLVQMVLMAVPVSCVSVKRRSCRSWLGRGC